jgi:anti-sigma-K factor RskA
VADHEFAGLRCADVADLAPAFVLGALESAETDAVRRHLASCPEAHAEVAEFGSVVPALFDTVELVAPPAGLKDRILAAAATQPQRTVDAQPAAGLQPARDARPAERTRDPRRQPAPDDRVGNWADRLFRRPIWAAVAVAAALAVVALGAWNLQLRDEIAGLTAYRNGVVEVLDQAAGPGAQLAVLSTPEGPDGPTGLAAVSADGRVALVMRDLAPTTGTQVYETWLIGADGAPIPIGDFRVGGSGTASFSAAHASLGPGVVVALTLEPGPGATAPTMPIIAAGQARAQES